MSFLAPFYIAGLVAISLPILFHLIKRTPQGRQVFSSLMFLTPSPPRMTRRSRLSNILLLILRASALILLALAFARPFLKQNSDLILSQGKGKRVALLIDTSASMQRGDLWQQAIRQADQVLGDLAPTDEVALYFFDKDVRQAFTFKQWNDLEPSRRAPMLRARLNEEKPTWASTNVGSALSTVADQLTENESSNKESDSLGRQVILFSDLQQGSHIEALQGHQWPSNVALDVKRLSLEGSSNASVQLVKESIDPAEKADGRLRIRVSNQPDSTREQLSLAWANDKGPLVEVEPTKVYVAPGRSQIVRMAWPTSQPSPTDRIVLAGDDADFDNTLYIVQPRQDTARIVFLGDDASDDIKGLRFYLERAIAPTADRKVEIISRGAEEPLADTDLVDVRLIAVTGTQSAARAATIRKFIDQGGDVLWVLKDAAAAGGLEQVSQAGAIQVNESNAAGFVLLSQVTMDHPLFTTFSDTRYADFAKIHFWKHRTVKVPDGAGIRAIATFDNGHPFLLEQMIGRGRLWVATSGWHPADSQLALSTKFVPLIDGMVKRKDGTIVESQYSANEAISLPLSQGSDPGARSMRGPDGRIIELASNVTQFNGADRPGIYHLTTKGQDTPIAVNLAADEGRTSPVAVEEFEQYGAKLGVKPASDDAIAQQRRLQVVELENKQKLWRWVIVAVLGLLVAETLLAGRLAHRQTLQQVTS